MKKAIQYTRQLEEVGLTRDQAETHIQILSSVAETELATKSDLQEMKSEMNLKFNKLEHKIDSIDHRFKSIDKRFDSMDHRFESMESSFNSMEHRVVLKLGLIVVTTVSALATFLKYVA